MPTPAYPTLMPQPFASGAGAHFGGRNPIPVASAVPNASLADGFPDTTMLPITGGGVPVAGQDFNGILNWITQHIVWSNTGGQYQFNGAIAVSIGGYPAGMVLQNTAGTGSFISTVAGNTQDPNAGPFTITASCATNVLTVTATVGVLAVGTRVIGTGIPLGTFISSLGTGTGGNGTYNLSSTPGTLGSGALLATGWDSFVGCIQPIFGAVSRPQRDKNLDWVSVFEWFTQAQRDDVRSRTGSIDVSGAIMAAHAALVGTGKMLYFPSGIYLWATAQTTAHAPVWVGEAPEAYDLVHPSMGVQFKCTVTGGANYALKVIATGFENMVHFRNIRFTGGGTASNALYLDQVGNTGSLENVCIDRFTGWGLNSGYIQDIKFWNIFIYDCGKTAATFGLGLGTTSNQIHFYGGRIESCPGLIKADSVTGVFFTDMHIENPVGMAVPTSPIQILTSLAVKFKGCFLSAPGVAAYMALNSQSADAVPAMVYGFTNTDLLFEGCSFVNNDGTGSKWLNIVSSFQEWDATVMGCHFKGQDCQTFGIIHQYGKFIDNHITMYDNGTTTNFKVAQITYAICDGNTVSCNNPSSTAKVAGYVFQSTAASPLNILGSNVITVNKLFKFSNANWYTNNLGASVYTPITVVGGAIDLETRQENAVHDILGVNLTQMNNAKFGQIVTLYNSGAACTITHGGTLFLKGQVNATLGSLQLIKFQNWSGINFEISRNF